MAILELKDINYAYNKEKKVLDHIDCCFEEGVFYAIVGKSGAGKSTLLSLMAGLDLPDSGEILFEGIPTSKMDRNEYRRSQVSVIYQDFALFPSLSVLENIMYPMELVGIDSNQARNTAKELAGRVMLNESLFDKYPDQISGGEQQRVAIARGLTNKRKLILADEPTGNLDSENSDIIIKILTKLAHEEGCCIIVVTHDLTLMEKADVVYRVMDGKLIKK